MPANRTPHQLEDQKQSRSQAAPQSSQDAQQASDQQPAEKAQRAQTAHKAEPEKPSKPTDIYDVLRFCLGLLIQQAWIHLGIQADPATDQTKTDLPKARIAIDAASQIWSLLQDHASEAEKRDVEMTLTNLRINFAQRA